MIRSSNPAFRDNAMVAQGRADFGQEVMTAQGAATKALILLLIVAVTAGYTWTQAATNPEAATPLMIGGAIVGFILALVTTFKRQWSPITAPLYAAMEGLFLGGISMQFEMRYPGIAAQAVGLTAAVFAAMMISYKTGFVRATDSFKRGIFAVTGGIAIAYLGVMLLSLFHVNMPFLYDSSPLSIGISVVVSIVAALNLIIDFDVIEQGARARAPKYMEWYGAFALLVTLVWLYIELLRLLSKMRSSRN